MAPKVNSKVKSAPVEKKPEDKQVERRERKPLIEVVLVGSALLLISAAASRISQLNLSPVYGSIPSAIYHQHGITFTTLLAFITKRALQKQGQDPYRAREWIGPFAAYIPAIQSLLFTKSSIFGAEWGPVVTEALTCYPLLLLCFMSAYRLLDEVDLSRFGATRAEAPMAVAWYAAFSGLDTVLQGFFSQIVGKSDFFSRSGLQLLVATFSSLLTSSNMILLGVPAMLHAMMGNPHYYGHSGTKLANSTLAEAGFTLLERQDSNTGYISVLRNDNDDFLALRCDHSILGGEWLVTPNRIRQGQNQKETIYSVFTMLESVRLVKTEDYSADEEKDALFIGLGIGTSPKAFIAHGINTTIVELDPVVHQYATKYFELPSNHTAVIQDAVPWVEKTSAQQPEIYDYIVHDVFTGGAEPTPLFTLEFLQGLERLLKPDGVIAINYAADINLPPSRIILDTINVVFPSCRIYRDTLPAESEETFLNMIVFCRKSPKLIEFRLPTNSDFLGSLARRQFVPPDDAYEIKLAEIGGANKFKETVILKRGGEDIIEKYHNEAALRHWRIMRTVLPNEVWETW